MPDKVIGIRPGVVAQEAGPDNDVVKGLEELLERARAGELRGYAIATVSGMGETCSVGTAWDGLPWTRWPLGAAVGILLHRYTQALLHDR